MEDKNTNNLINIACEIKSKINSFKHVICVILQNFIPDKNTSNLVNSAS